MWSLGGSELNIEEIQKEEKEILEDLVVAAVNKALEMVMIDDEIIEAHELVGGNGTVISEVFE